MKRRVSLRPMMLLRFLRWAALAAVVPALLACVSRTLEPGIINPTATVKSLFTQKINNEIDILFMVDNSSSMTLMQTKLVDQLPMFMQVLKDLPMGLPSLHVAVVTSDMGAHSDNTLSGCSEFGNDGAFQFAPEKECTNTTLTAGSTYISDVNGVANFTDPIEKVFQCIAATGDKGCGFEQQLASIDHALGADNVDSNGKPQPPPSNAGFLRDEAYLGIVMLTNEDDASAPHNTPIFSLNGGPLSIKNPDGPLANYRQNGGPHSTHLCQDPASANPTAYIPEPIQVPPDAQGTAATPTLSLVGCKDNDSGSSEFYPVSKFISDIKKLKPDPDGQILIGGIIGPPTPVDVGWFPSGLAPQDPAANELWPDQLHSCGEKGSARLSPHATQFSADGSFADPGIRLDKFIQAFPNYYEGSICDTSYASSMLAIAKKLGQLLTPPCITQKIQNDTKGNPMCSVTEHLTTMQGTTQDLAIPNCAENGNSSPCWSMPPGGMNCAGVQLKITETSNTNPATENATVECSLCLPGTTQPGC